MMTIAMLMRATGGRAKRSPQHRSGPRAPTNVESLQIDANSRCGWGATKWPAVSKNGCKVYLFGKGTEW